MLSFTNWYSSYNQIKMSTLDASKTVSTTKICNIYYKLMLFSLKNYSDTYQRVMHIMFVE